MSVSDLQLFLANPNFICVDYQERVLELVSQEYEADKLKGEPKKIKVDGDWKSPEQVQAVA